MTYKQAKIIQSIVFDLNSMNTNRTFECSIEPMDGEGQYYCYLYSYNDSQLEYMDLYQLALGLHACVANICYFPDRNTIRIDDENRQSIRMW